MEHLRKILAAIAVMAVLSSLFPGNARGVTSPSTVKVGLSITETNVDFEAVSGSFQILNGTDSTLIGMPDRGRLWRASFTPDLATIRLFSIDSDGELVEVGSFESLIFVPDDLNESVFSCNDKNYRGSLILQINLNSSGMVVINELGLEPYLYSVVAREMSNTWPMEALKAQAVAARTYALRNINKHEVTGFNVCSGTCCQAYGGLSYEGDQVRQAVDSTRGQVLVDGEGKLIAALFHSNSGGYTEDNVNVNGYYFDYLQGKSDPYSLGYGLADWSFSTSVNSDGSGTSIEEKLKTSFPDISSISGFVLGKYPSGRVYEVKVSDQTGRVFSLTGKQFGNLFNPGFYTSINKDSFMSTMFDIETNSEISLLTGYGQVVNFDGGLEELTLRSPSTITPLTDGGNTLTVRSASEVKTFSKSPSKATIVGHGWGHGVGMSQWGAYGMAKLGKSYQEILQFYYDGTDLASLEQE